MVLVGRSGRKEAVAGGGGACAWDQRLQAWAAPGEGDGSHGPKVGSAGRVHWEKNGKEGSGPRRRRLVVETRALSTD